MNSTESKHGTDRRLLDKEKIVSLVTDLPVLKDLFDIHYKVGEGTFSSVFLATLKSSREKKKFAIKYLTATYPPSRLERELNCLQQIGGADNVVGIELCLRNAGSIAIVMPYMRHDPFSDYVKNMDAEELKRYMRGLLIAVRKVHKFNIIHRDVKPSNFLYDRKQRKYLLVDFGLAEVYNPEKQPSETQTLLSDVSSIKRKRGDENSVSSSLANFTKSAEKKCYCFGKAKICSLCLSRPGQTAPRAGTPGYRPPEVLLKYPYQTPAIDVWACGVIMLCILSGTQSFFYCPDDCTALAQITTIFGSASMSQCARKLGKKLIFSENIPSIDLPSLCQKLHDRNKNAGDSAQHVIEENVQPKYPPEAYCLLIRLLDIDHKTRITADQALNHPFLQL